MAIRKAEAIWKGNLLEGTGEMKSGSGVIDVAFTHGTRFKDDDGTNPEELIGAANAGCFSMFLSSLLTKEGYPPEEVRTTAAVHLERDEVGPKVTLIELDTTVRAPGLSEDRFQELATEAKVKCPISRALAGPNIVLEARLA